MQSRLAEEKFELDAEIIISWGATIRRGPDYEFGAAATVLLSLGNRINYEFYYSIGNEKVSHYLYFVNY